MSFEHITAKFEAFNQQWWSTCKDPPYHQKKKQSVNKSQSLRQNQEREKKNIVKWNEILTLSGVSFSVTLGESFSRLEVFT